MYFMIVGSPHQKIKPTKLFVSHNYSTKIVFLEVRELCLNEAMIRKQRAKKNALAYLVKQM